MSEVKVKGNALERALKTLKKKMLREGVLKEVYERQAYEKPSVKKYVARLASEENENRRSKV